MNPLTKALLYILCIDFVLFIAQFSMVSINPDATMFYNTTHILKDYDSGNFTLDTDVTGRLPGGMEVSSESSGFTDIYNTVRSWITLPVKGLSYLIQLIGAPYFVLKAIFPGESMGIVVFGLGAVWVVFTLFLIVSWLFDRAT